MSIELSELLTRPAEEGEEDDFRRGQLLIESLDQREDVIGDLWEELHGLDLSATVSEAHRRASSRDQKLLLLYRLVKLQQPHRIVELGTGFGVATAHIAMACHRTSRSAQIATVEASAARQAVASEHIGRAGITGITYITGLFDGHLAVLEEADFVFIDGNHYFDPTMRYVDAAIDRGARPLTLALDDVVGYSDEMEAVRERLREDQRFTSKALHDRVLIVTVGRTPLDQFSRPRVLRRVIGGGASSSRRRSQRPEV